jgi:hypothetical protein
MMPARITTPFVQMLRAFATLSLKIAGGAPAVPGAAPHCLFCNKS